MIIWSVWFRDYIENEVRVSSAIVKYRDFIGSFIKAKLWDFQPQEQLT